MNSVLSVSCDICVTFYIYILNILDLVVHVLNTVFGGLFAPQETDVIVHLSEGSICWKKSELQLSRELFMLLSL